MASQQFTNCEVAFPRKLGVLIFMHHAKTTSSCPWFPSVVSPNMSGEQRDIRRSRSNHRIWQYYSCSMVENWWWTKKGCFHFVFYVLAIPINYSLESLEHVGTPINICQLGFGHLAKYHLTASYSWTVGFIRLVQANRGKVETLEWAFPENVDFISGLGWTRSYYSPCDGGRGAPPHDSQLAKSTKSYAWVQVKLVFLKKSHGIIWHILFNYFRKGIAWASLVNVVFGGP